MDKCYSPFVCVPDLSSADVVILRYGVFMSAPLLIRRRRWSVVPCEFEFSGRFIFKYMRCDYQSTGCDANYRPELAMQER
jgi:hypothetical protein